MNYQNKVFFSIFIIKKNNIFLARSPNMDLEKRIKSEEIQSRNNIQIKLITIKWTSLLRLGNQQNL